MSRARTCVGASKLAASNASKRDGGRESAKSPAAPNSESAASLVIVSSADVNPKSEGPPPRLTRSTRWSAAELQPRRFVPSSPYWARGTADEAELVPPKSSSLSLAQRALALLAKRAGGLLVEEGLIRHGHTLLDRNLRCPAGGFDLGNISQFARCAIWLGRVKGQVAFVANGVFD